MTPPAGPMRPPRRLLLAGALGLGWPAAAPGLAQGQAGGQTLAQAGPPPPLAALAAQANAGAIGIISGGIDGTYARIAADLAAVLDDGDALRVLPVLGKGSLQNLRDVLVLRGIDLGIVQSDVLAFARARRLLPGIDGLIQYVTKLYDEEVHLLAGPGVTRVEALAGRTVNMDLRGSGTAMTAALLFEALGIPVTAAHEPQDLALARLRRGEIAALVFVAGKPARLFAGIDPAAAAELRFLPLPATPALLESYLPSELTHADYPALVPEGDGVRTLAVGAVLAVYAWAPGTERHRKVARFVQALHARFDAFQHPPRHPKWRDVNLAAQVPGWARFDPLAVAPRVPPPRGPAWPR